MVFGSAVTARVVLAYAYIGAMSVWIGHTFWKYPQGWFLWVSVWLLAVWTGLNSRKNRARPVIKAHDTSVVAIK